MISSNYSFAKVPVCFSFLSSSCCSWKHLFMKTINKEIILRNPFLIHWTRNERACRNSSNRVAPWAVHKRNFLAVHCAWPSRHQPGRRPPSSSPPRRMDILPSVNESKEAIATAKQAIATSRNDSVLRREDATWIIRRKAWSIIRAKSWSGDEVKDHSLRTPSWALFVCTSWRLLVLAIVVVFLGQVRHARVGPLQETKEEALLHT